jgi:FkbM family methyltransferase
MTGEDVDNITTCQVREETILLKLDSTKEGGPQERNWELWRVQGYATKEPDTLDWIDSFLQPGDVVYDIGANIGQYSLYAAKRLRGDCAVLAFEPESLNYAKLNENIVLNGLSEVITAYCLAVAGRTALDTFYVKRFSPGASLHAFGQPIGQGDVPFPPMHSQGMMGVTLDDLVGRFSLPFPHHIKIDVDGIEDLIIEGAEGMLADPRLKSVLVEVYMHKDVAAKIERAFYRHQFGLHNAAAVTYEPGTAQNLIFTR